MASWKYGKIKFGFLETATSGGTLTLTSASLQYQILTGTLAHTVVLPVSTTMFNGLAFSVVNTSTGTVTVKYADGTTTLVTLVADQGAVLYLTDNSTSNGVWAAKIGGASAASGFGSIAPGATKISNYTIVTGDNGGIIDANTSAGSFNITLPAPTAAFKVTIKDIGGMAGTNNINIIRNGSESIDGIAADTQIDENSMAITFIADGTNWSRFDSLHRSAISNTGRGLFGGGYNGSIVSVIDQITIATAANATSFGNLSQARFNLASCSSPTRGVFGGGNTTTGNNEVATIDYVTIATAGTATAFGSLTQSRQALAGLSNSTRGVFAGGVNFSTVYNNIDHITIANLSSASVFGNLSVARYSLRPVSSSTRGVFAMGINSGFSSVNTMDYITIATTGNATSFGTTAVAKFNSSGCSNSIRGLFAGGNNGGENVNNIDYITIATTGNTTSFGTLTTSRSQLSISGCSSAINAVFAGGDTGSPVNIIDYVTIATLSNASNFGNLTGVRSNSSGCSSSHGGLSG